MIQQAKHMKATYEAQTPEEKKRLKSRQELNALVAEQVERALQNQKKKSASNKKKRELQAIEDAEISDDSHSVTSINSDDWRSGRLSTTTYNTLDECINQNYATGFARRLTVGHTPKKPWLTRLVPVTYGRIVNQQLTKDDQPSPLIKVLLDSGCSETIITYSFVKHLALHKRSEVTWATTAGEFTTSHKCITHS